MRIYFLFIGLVSALAFVHCGSADDTSSDDTATDPETVERLSIKLSPGLSTEEALSAVSTDGYNPELTVTVNWPSHSSDVVVPAGTVEEQAEWLREREYDHLNELLTHFDPEDRLEAKPYAQLQASLDALEEEAVVPISNIEADLDLVAAEVYANPQVRDTSLRIVEIRGEDEAEDEDMDSLLPSPTAFMISDLPGDADYDPARGTSTIWNNSVSTGSVQEFWLDDTSIHALKGKRAGIEIKTLIKPRNLAKCGQNWDTNMPNKDAFAYRDSEDFDWITSRSARVCAVGHMDVEQLKANELYWTWISFDQFKANKNPKIEVQWVPTEYYTRANVIPFLDKWAEDNSVFKKSLTVFIKDKCLTKQEWCNVDSALSAQSPVVRKGLNAFARRYYVKGKCENDRGWCMFSRDDMPIEWLVKYDYQDATNGIEVPWYRDK